MLLKRLCLSEAVTPSGSSSSNGRSPPAPGRNPASQSYVRSKNKTAHDLGFHSVQESHPADITEEKLLGLVDKYNKDSTIHGILVQLPLPKHINEEKVCGLEVAQLVAVVGRRF